MLLSQIKLLDDLGVSSAVEALQVFQKPAPAADQLEKPPLGGEVLRVTLEMRGDALDPFTQDRDLGAGASRIRGSLPEFSDNVCFGLFCDHSVFNEASPAVAGRKRDASGCFLE